MFAYCGNNPIMHADPEGDFWLSAILIGVAIVATALLSGCSNSKSSSTSSPRKKPTPTTSQTPTSTNVTKRSQQEKEYAATVYAEAGGQNKTTKSAVAHVMNNRVGSGFGNDLHSVLSQPYQFDGYGSQMFDDAMQYYNSGICNNEIDKNSMDECMDVIIPIYAGEGVDITDGALYFHSFSSHSDWTYHDYYELVDVSGTENFWFYK